MKYLYGASVQGIQNFIFQTDKLRDIVGASELVEEICTTQFAKILYQDEAIDYASAKTRLSGNTNALLFAAGNVKYVFDDKESCENVVRVFPKVISSFAPGIAISQAVVEYDSDFSDAVNELEMKLRIQRNRQVKDLTSGPMGVLRSRQTGLPVVKCCKDEYLDAGTYAKRNRDTTQHLSEKAFGHKVLDRNIPYDLSMMTGQNDWLAIVHIDGNGMGQVVQKVGLSVADFRRFSQKLDHATARAAVSAIKEVKAKHFPKEDLYPIRPIVLGGDDFTFVCRADLALDLTSEFLKSFEEFTKDELGDILISHNVFDAGEVRDRLTACAGIAYVKSSFPFHYGYDLAEELCSEAKRDAKAGLSRGELPQSSLMFHKVQDSFIQSYSDIEGRELQPQPGISFKFGPYYVEDKSGRWTIGHLAEYAAKLEGESGNAVKSHLRKWLSAMYYSPEYAAQIINRLESITSMKSYVREVTAEVSRDGRKVYPVYDILSILTVNTQNTK